MHGARLIEVELLQAVKDHASAREEGSRVEDLVQLGGRHGTARVGLELLAERGASGALLDLAPGGHGVLLHDGVGLLAGDARLHQGKKDLGGEDQPPRLVEVGEHLRRVENQAVNDAREALEHVVEGDEAVSLRHALGGAVADVTLVPEGHVVKGNLRVGLHHAGEAADLLDGDGIALVRHGRAALLPLAERLLRLEGVGLLEIADLRGDALAGGGGGGQDAGEVGVVVARDDLRGDWVDA